MAEFAFLEHRIVHFHNVRVVAFAVHARRPVVALGRHGNGVQIHAGSQHTAVLVVGVIAAHLGAARRAEHIEVAPFAEPLLKAVNRLFHARRIAQRFLFSAGVNMCESLKGFLLPQRGAEHVCLHGDSP